MFTWIMASRGGRWEWSLGEALNDDEWSALLTCHPYLIFIPTFQLHHNQLSNRD